MLNLEKGVSTPFEKSVNEVEVQLRWNGNVDNDVYAFALGSNGRIGEDEKDVCYFGNKRLYAGAIVHSGDQRTGDTIVDAPDEVMKFRLQEIPTHIDKIVVFASIYKAPTSGQTFGMMSEFTATILTDGTKVATVDLPSQSPDDYGCSLLSMQRNGAGWSITPLNTSEKADLNVYLARYM